jgi:hypothetical protein
MADLAASGCRHLQDPYGSLQAAEDRRDTLRGEQVDNPPHGARTMDCKQNDTRARCTCTYEPCARKGKCCDCLDYHLRLRELPGCAFDARGERTYNRSFEHFARLVADRRI